MSLTSSPNKITYQGDGNKKEFPIPFPIIKLPTGEIDSSTIKVYVADPKKAKATLLTSNYTIKSNNGNYYVQYPLSGQLLPKYWYLTIDRDLELKQELVLSNNAPFNPKSLEKQLDFLTMIIQQLQEQLNRCYKVNIAWDSPLEGFGTVLVSCFIGKNINKVSKEIFILKI